MPSTARPTGMLAASSAIGAVTVAGGGGVPSPTIRRWPATSADNQISMVAAVARMRTHPGLSAVIAALTVSSATTVTVRTVRRQLSRVRSGWVAGNRPSGPVTVKARSSQPSHHDDAQQGAGAECDRDREGGREPALRQVLAAPHRRFVADPVVHRAQRAGDPEAEQDHGDTLPDVWHPEELGDRDTAPHQRQ